MCVFQHRIHGMNGRRSKMSKFEFALSYSEWTLHPCIKFRRNRQCHQPFDACRRKTTIYTLITKATRIFVSVDHLQPRRFLNMRWHASDTCHQRGWQLMIWFRICGNIEVIWTTQCREEERIDYAAVTDNRGSKEHLWMLDGEGGKQSFPKTPPDVHICSTYKERCKCSLLVNFIKKRLCILRDRGFENSRNPVNRVSNDE